MITDGKKEKVFVGLSGGVDSSVAAARLIAASYNVVGVFIKVWHPDWMVCNWEQERLDAMRVAAHLGIPFLTCDAVDAYRDDVAHYFTEEYKAGRTPNPDIMCNQHVKFGRFLDWSKEQGADYIATGHYVQRVDGEDGPELHRGVDQNKDQTYFLATLTKEQLKYSLFPVGDTTKKQIRAEATRANIPVATKKDSQGICFLGHVDIAEFLSYYVALTPGAVVNTAGEKIGEHKGALVYTLGQRHGFTINSAETERSALYVVARDIKANTITVETEPKTIETTEEITLQNIVVRTQLSVGDTYVAQFRYRQSPFAIEIVSVEPDKLLVRPIESTIKPAAGQTCVLYDGPHCLGGGIIC